MEVPKSFCILPWTSLLVHQDGGLSTCCHGNKRFQRENEESNFYLYKDSLVDAFSSPTLLDIRKNLLSGVKDSNCASCWAQEGLGQRSARMIENEVFAQEVEAVLAGNIPEQPISLNINPGNVCNLKCRICGPGASSKWTMEALDIYQNDWISRPKELSSMPKEQSRNLLLNWPETNLEFWSTIESWLPKIKLFNFTGGEPFLSKRHFAVLDKSVSLGYANNQSIRYNTNGTIFPEHAAANIFPKFKHVQILLSLDGTGERFEYQRHGANWNDVLENVGKFQKIPNVFVGVCISVSAINIFYLLDELDFWLKADVPVYLNLVNGPPHFNVNALPPLVKESLRKKFAAADLKKYEKILMNKVEAIIGAIFAEDNSHQWPKFLECISVHDKYRGENFSKTFPEYYALLQSSKKRKIPETFCSLPWSNVQVRPDGRMAACAHSMNAYRSNDGEDLHLYKNSISEGFNSKYAQDLRKNLISGVQDENCRSCWDAEAVGQKSRRQFELEEFPEETQEILNESYVLDQPIFLDISPGNLCNLKCRICNEAVSSLWEKEASDLKLPRRPMPPSIEALAQSGKAREVRNWPETNPQFWKEVEGWLPKIKKFNFVGGEPFLSRAHFDLLAKSVAQGYSKNQVLQYNTNGTIYPEHQFREVFPNFKWVQIWLSLDGIGDRFEYQRHGAKWDRVLANVDRFFTHDYVSFGVCITVSSINILYLFETLDFWLARGVKVYLGDAVGAGLNIKCMPRDVKLEILARFEEVDIKKYDPILLNRVEAFFEILKTEGEPDNWGSFLRSIKKHDQYRSEDFSKTFPEAANLYFRDRATAGPTPELSKCFEK